MGMDRYGDKNENIKFGILEISNEEIDGFGAFAKVVLGALIIMDERNLLPFIDIKSTCYTERHKVNGTFNTFEYYFVQPCDVISKRHIPRSEILQSANVEFIPEADARNVLDGHMKTHGFYSIFNNQELLAKAAEVLRKYIRINSFSRSIYDEVKGILNEQTDVIGIHVRLTGFKVPTPLHPIAVEPTEHLELFKKIRKSRKAFLATDDEVVIDLFSNDDEYKKGNIFWYDDVLRTPKEISAENISIYCCEDERDNHKYKLGYEILKEILTLSYCESLIAGFSNVSLIANLVKMSRGEKYKDYCIIDKGVWGKEYYDSWEYYRNTVKAMKRDFASSGK